MQKQIAILVGSSSSTSFSQLVAKHLQTIAPENLNFNFINIAHLPLYDRDLDSNSPAEYQQFRSEIEKADAILFITPEHNSGMSAMIKNAIDIGSRPMGQSKWIGKPAGIVSVAAGVAGGVRAADQLRTVAAGAFINMPVLPFAANVGGVFNGVFNEQGEIIADNVKATLKGFIESYAAFIARF